MYKDKKINQRKGSMEKIKCNDREVREILRK
jgi:hypothetical protein